MPSCHSGRRSLASRHTKPWSAKRPQSSRHSQAPRPSVSFGAWSSTQVLPNCGPGSCSRASMSCCQWLLAAWWCRAAPAWLMGLRMRRMRPSRWIRSAWSASPASWSSLAHQKSVPQAGQFWRILGRGRWHRRTSPGCITGRRPPPVVGRR